MTTPAETTEPTTTHPRPRRPGRRVLAASGAAAGVLAAVAAGAVTAAILAAPSATPSGVRTVAARPAAPAAARAVTPAAVTLAGTGVPGWLPPNAKQVTRFQRGSLVHVGYALPGAVNGAQSVPVAGGTVALGATGLSFDTLPYGSTALPAPPPATDGITVTDFTVLGQPARLVHASTNLGPFVLTWVSGGKLHVLTTYRWSTPLGITGVTGATLTQVAQSVPAGQ